MSLVLNGALAFFWRIQNPKIEDKQVPGIYIYISYIYTCRGTPNPSHVPHPTRVGWRVVGRVPSQRPFIPMFRWNGEATRAPKNQPPPLGPKEQC